ncbi:antibiotic biosynthesis monooxygenase family protein [Hymenobacter sp. HDW8]|uniref:antibiotic biosynthesis monooxygenase family protein n=1 Tax=Hymenobacter sp. HDW8 TaxID=2714932 RepID=UPI00140D6CA0|nr:antibiotic biosynthesis monooxygenase [Hymenobacter sp. HDW8]QIL77574.1 antibiotic biosynthesis monooxygenase [Hymenobacter sp. HDW8]
MTKISAVITRIWHGVTHAHHAEEYLRYLEASGLADYKKTPGNLGVQVLRSLEGEVCHFWTVTRWDSYDSIKQFAGDDYEKARYYPDDARYLLEFESNVIHCETFDF